MEPQSGTLGRAFPAEDECNQRRWPCGLSAPLLAPRSLSKRRKARRYLGRLLAFVGPINKPAPIG